VTICSDRRTNWQNYDSQDRASTAASLSKIALGLSTKLWIRSSRIFEDKAVTNNCATITPPQIEHGWRLPSWKCLWHHNSAADDPVRTKIYFADAASHADDDGDVNVETGSRISAWRLSFLLENGNRNRPISAADWAKLAKFGAPTLFRPSRMWLCETAAERKPWVDLRGRWIRGNGNQRTGNRGSGNRRRRKLWKANILTILLLNILNVNSERYCCTKAAE